MTDEARRATDDQARLEGRRTPLATVLIAVAWLLARLPEGPLFAAADSLGEIWYRTAPARRQQCRNNLRRVCEGLAAQGRGPRRARAAATDPEVLERLVRACFRHGARYYVEMARTSGYDIRKALKRVDIDAPEAFFEALREHGQFVLIGMHYGALELPALLVAHLVEHRVTVPMEAVADPGIQKWIVTSRARIGFRLIPLRDARRTLMASLRAGESIGMINDRDITHTGIPVPFFGADAPVSPGPALMAVETGTPIWVAAARRKQDGRYVVRLIPVPTPTEGSRRERMVGATRNMAVAFEDVLSDAPEQWWASHHAIWPDLVVGAAWGADDVADAEGAGARPSSKAAGPS